MLILVRKANQLFQWWAELFRTLRTFRKYGLIGAILRTLDYGIMLSLALPRKLYRPRSSTFGFFDALLYPDIYWWYRHTVVANHIRHWDYHSILDVGGGDLGISSFLDLRGKLCVVLDTDMPSVKSKRVAFIRGDACSLPFETKSFDIVCSVSVLPAIPKEHRSEFLEELKRVGKRVCFYSEALQDQGGLYRGLEVEIKYHELLKSMGQPYYSLERINRRRVELDEIKSFSLNYTGCQNCDVNYKLLQLGHRPLIRYLAGWMYLFVYKKRETDPPHRSVVAIFEEDSEEVSLVKEAAEQ